MEKLAERLDRPIVLVGLMGAGKSTVGRKLAQLLGTPFVDADDEVVEAAQMTIPEIFERFGEGYFRDGERRVIARIIDENVRSPAVIATGGGAFVDPRTRQLLNERAITVWLDAPVEVLAERTGRRNTRPMLRGGNRSATLARLSEQRQPMYSEAHIRILSGGGAHRDVVEAIIAAVGYHLGK